MSLRVVGIPTRPAAARAVLALRFDPGWLTVARAGDAVVGRCLPDGELGPWPALDRDLVATSQVVLPDDGASLVEVSARSLTVFDLPSGRARFIHERECFELIPLQGAEVGCICRARGGGFPDAHRLDVVSGVSSPSLGGLGLSTGVALGGTFAVMGANLASGISPGPRYSSDVTPETRRYRLYPRALAGGRLLMGLDEDGAILGAMNLRGSWAAGWHLRRPSGLHALALSAREALIVTRADHDPAALLILDAASGVEAGRLRLPFEHAETLTAAAMRSPDGLIAVGTSLGRVVFIAVEVRSGDGPETEFPHLPVPTRMQEVPPLPG